MIHVRKRGAEAYIVYGQPPTTGNGSSGNGLFGGLSGTLKLVGIASIVVIVGGSIFVLAEAARPVVQDVQLAEQRRSRR